MKKLYLFILPLVFSITQAQSPSWQWAKRCGSTGDNISQLTADESFNDVKVDKVGNVYAVGGFYTNTAFHNAQLFGQTTPLGYGQNDAYLMKYNACGSLLWYRRMGGTNVDEATSLVIDKAGNLVVLGISFSNPSVYSGGTNTITLTSLNSNGPQFLAKFDTSGTLLSVNTYSFAHDKLLLNSQGNYFITNGVFAATINTLGAVNSTLAFCSPTSAFFPTINGVALDRSDNIYLAGGFNNTVTLSTNVMLPPTPSTVFSGMAANSLIMKVGSNGVLQWYQRGFANGAGDVLGGVAIDTSQNKVILGGRVWNNSAVFGYNATSGVGTYANPYYFMNASNGVLISAQTGSTNGQGSIHPYYTDRDDNTYFKGRINSWLNIGTSNITVAGQPANWQNVIAKFDGGNNLTYLNLLPQIGSQSNKENIFSLDVSEQGNVYLAGMFAGTLDSLGTAVNVLGGAQDGFVAKFGFPCGSTVSALSPIAPTNLNATYQGTLTNLVNWVDHSNYESAYELWYNGSTPTFSLLSTLPANTTSYTHTALNYSTTYCYAARAINNIGPSVFTNTDCASTPAQTAPQTPSSLTALNSGTLTNNVNWVDNSFDEAGFELWYHDASPTFSLLATLPANTTTYIHTGLSYTTTYCYKALATNTIGSSAFTNTDCATTPQQLAPNAPSALTAANTGSLFNNVNWVDNSSNESAFELWYHDVSPTFSLLATLPANTTNYVHSGLTFTTSYCYKANALNAGGPSAFTNTDCATTPEEILDETSIVKNTSSKEFHIYPNPSSGKVFVELGLFSEELTIIVTDAIGRVIREDKVPVGSPSVHKLDLMGCKGMYFVQVRTKKGTQTEKVILE